MKTNNDIGAQLTAEWKRLAGVYVRAADAVRAADCNFDVSDEAYGRLVAVRERAFEALGGATRAGGVA